MLLYCVPAGYQDLSVPQSGARGTLGFSVTQRSRPLFDGAQGPLHLQCFHSVNNIIFTSAALEELLSSWSFSREYKASALLNMANMMLTLSMGFQVHHFHFSSERYFLQEINLPLDEHGIPEWMYCRKEKKSFVNCYSIVRKAGQKQECPKFHHNM